MSVLASGSPGRVLEKYRIAKLIPLLELIRKPDRYAGMKGINALTNAALGDVYDKAEVTRELRRAHESKDPDFLPQFSHPMQGFAYGLNPYTDWALAQMEAPPTHYYLFLGLDWYSISDLGHTDSWFGYLHNPFGPFAPSDNASYDRYWHNIWAWILQKYRGNSAGQRSWDVPTKEGDAAAFIRKDEGAFIFHNRIPYLRPAGCPSAGTSWYEKEWKNKSVRDNVIEDLRLLRLQTEQADGRIMAICTNRESEKTLLDAGFANTLSLKAHPSRGIPRSTPAFRGPNYFLSRKL
jgi:hypothetical protein